MQTQRETIETLVEKYLALAEKKYPTLKRPKLLIDLSLKGRTAGQMCTNLDYNTGKLRINCQLFDHGLAEVEGTVGHEIAHLVANTIYRRNVGHGIHWKTVARNLGVKPVRCHDLPLTPARKTVHRFINCCDTNWDIGPRVYKALINGTRRASCPKCKQILDPHSCWIKSNPLTTDNQ